VDAALGVEVVEIGLHRFEHRREVGGGRAGHGAGGADHVGVLGGGGAGKHQGEHREQQSPHHRRSSLWGSTSPAPWASSRSSASLYIESIRSRKRAYICARFTLRVGVTGSPSSSGSSALGRIRNALICSTRASC